MRQRRTGGIVKEEFETRGEEEAGKVKRKGTMHVASNAEIQLLNEKYNFRQFTDGLRGSHLTNRTNHS